MRLDVHCHLWRLPVLLNIFLLILLVWVLEVLRIDCVEACQVRVHLQVSLRSRLVDLETTTAGGLWRLLSIVVYHGLQLLDVWALLLQRG